MSKNLTFHSMFATGRYFFIFVFVLKMYGANCQGLSRTTINFNRGWRFKLDSTNAYNQPLINDANWRTLNLPHDWSIEFDFDSTSPTGTGGGALRGGVGWYRKTFALPKSDKGKNIFIDFDGVYMNSEVWINGHYLGLRPNGFISFRYDLSPYLNYGRKKNVIAVKVDNSKQPNSRWYSGSGIYRNVWLITVGEVYVDHWGTYVTTPRINKDAAFVRLRTLIRTGHNKPGGTRTLAVKNTIYNNNGKPVAISRSIRESNINPGKDTTFQVEEFTIQNPDLWSVEKPYLYKAVTQIIINRKVVDEYTTTFGIRNFNFDANTGFSLNGKPMKINGVCNHQDLGCLGTAINRRALQRQLEKLKAMGCNGIRTSHNPPAPELLDICDEMGFLVMDEAFDMWKKPKNRYDYHLYWDDWHKKDLEDQVLRDRNHPCVIAWSIGNEIPEQWGGKTNEDSSGILIARELAAIIKNLDTTRPVTAALNEPYPNNAIIRSGALDLIGYNYHHKEFANFQKTFPGQKFIGTETVSALETRGEYLMPADSLHRWPERWDKPFNEGTPNLTCSSYDNVSTPWGSTHEETWKVVKKYNFLSGQFIWTGFDYIGEPTPYRWPARSSYFGIIDLAGFPKDLYYMYQAEWTSRPVLHLFPHWNWKQGDTVDIICYYNNADGVELFLNGKSLGTKSKTGEDLHIKWRVPYDPGTLKAFSKKDGKIVLTSEVQTAGAPARLILNADRKTIDADGNDLSFVTVTVVDKNGTVVPYADNLIQFAINGAGFIAGVDNGSQTSLESFKGHQHRALNGLALVVVQSNGKKGTITVTGSSASLESSALLIATK
ncbi:MAG: beta-galactosidase GalB [Ginsengibacter sp.]